MKITLPQIVNSKNYLLNSNFDFGQRNNSGTIDVANGASGYGPDRWYAKNSLGTNGILTIGKNSGSAPVGSSFSGLLFNAVAPTAAQANGTEMYQTIENKLSQELYGKVASFGVQIKAFGLVTQIGLQFYYATSEIKVDTPIGTEKLFTVSTSGFTQCNLNGQALGTAQGAAGVIGVRIRITGVSSGNLYALNNGFYAGRAMVNIGSTVADYRRCEHSLAAEFVACKRFYEKSYTATVDPGTASSLGSRIVGPNTAAGTGVYVGPTQFSVEKRSIPTVTIYSPSGTTAKMWDNTDLDVGSGAAANNIGTNGWRYNSITGGTAGVGHAFHFTADAEI